MMEPCGSSDQNKVVDTMIALTRRPTSHWSTPAFVQWRAGWRRATGSPAKTVLERTYFRMVIAPSSGSSESTRRSEGLACCPRVCLLMS